MHTYLPEDNKIPPIEEADWFIEYIPYKNMPEKHLRVCNFVLRKRPEYVFESISCEYVPNYYDFNAVYWIKHAIGVKCKSLTPIKGIRIKVTLTSIPSREGKDIEIIVDSNNRTTIKVAMKPGWQEYTSPPIKINDSEIDITLTCDADPCPISDADPRLATFAITKFEIIPLTNESIR